MSLALFMKQIGATSTTIWRWRKKGVLKVVNLYGRLYVTAVEVENFNRRLEAGEFAQRSVVPKPRQKSKSLLARTSKRKAAEQLDAA